MKIFMVLLLLTCVEVFLGCASKPTPPTHEYLPGWDVSCKTLNDTKETNVCVHKKGEPKETLVYLHGLACNQDILQGKGCVISQGESEKEFMRGLNDVIVVTVSMGATAPFGWLLDPFPPKSKANQDATTKNFMEKVLPEAQEAFGNFPRPWSLIGHSMGGLNAAELALSYPSSWKKVLLIHPMIYDCDPWKPVEGLKCGGGIFFIGAEFPQEKWVKAEPIARMRTQTQLPRTRVFVCEVDQFGLVGGPKLFVNIGQSRGLPIDSNAYGDCSHYDIPYARMLTFLKE